MATILEDDFHNRVTKELRSKFVEDVIPSHIIPYLECLTRIDEEKVQAKEKNEGATLAAVLLFELIIRKPNWQEDLKRAFRHSSVELPHLAEAIENFLVEVPMRWDISGFEDNCGLACFDGNCSTHTGAKEAREDDDVSIPEEDREKTASNTDSRLAQQLAAEKAEIELRRESLRLKIMETIWSKVKKLEDVPEALDFIDRANLQLKGFEKGSLLFKVRVNSPDGLERLQQLFMYGGMKKILDRELIHKHMELFKDIAKSENLELLHIKSKLNVHEADLQRCKFELMSKRVEQSVLEYTKDLLISNFSAEGDILMQKGLKEIFPPFCIKIMGDPFLQSRLPKFFKIRNVADTLKRQFTPLMKNDTPGMSRLSQETHAALESVNAEEFKSRLENKRPLYELFFQWIEEEIVEFLKSLDHDDLKNIIQVSTKLIMNEMEGISGSFSIKGDVHRSFRLFPPVDLTATPTADEYKNMFIRSESLGLVCKKEGNYEFYSHYLRDMVMAYLLINYDFMEQVGDKVYMFEFLPLTIIQVYEDELSAETIFRTFSEKNLDLSKAIRHSCLGSGHTKPDMPVDRRLHLSSDFAEPNLSIDWLWFYGSSLDMEGFLSHGLSNIYQITTKSKTGITIKITTSEEITELLYLISNRNSKLLLERCGILETNSEIDISVALEGGHILTSKNFEHLSQFLGISKFTTKLDMSLCGTIPVDFKRHLETGNFANIKHLNLSGTKISLNATESFGLRYMPRLQTIDVHNCYLRDSGIVSLGYDFALLKELRELNIANNEITSNGLQDLSNMMNQNHLITAIRIHNNCLGPEGGVVLAGWLKNLYLLDTLNISLCRIGDVGMRYISSSIVSKVLRQISVRENEVTKDGSAFFFQNLKCKQMIEHLDYGGNSVFSELDETHAYEETLEGQSSDKELDAFLLGQSHWGYLNLWKCNLGKQRIFQNYESFQGMKTLVYLCLQSNQIDDKFAEDVGVCLKHCEQIRHINLRHNRIGNSGALAIADGVADKQYLEELLIDRNLIEEVGVRELLKVTFQIDHGFKLNISFNNLAVSAIDRFVEELSLQEVSESSKDVSDEQEPNTYYVPVNKPEIQIYM